MRTISCKLEDLKNMVLHIGYEGENDYTSVRIDAGSVFAQYPEAVPSLKVQPPKGNMYPVIVTRDGDIVIWNVSDSDTASNGNGEIQLTFTENTVVVKSCTGKTLVHRSLKSTGPAPDPLIDFIDMAEEVVGEAKDAAEAAEAAAQHAPMIGLDGYWYKWDAETEGYVKTDTKARGEDGENGVGITSVEKISTVGLVDTYRINFTNGTNTTYTVTNGQDGSVPIDDTTPAANKVFSSAKVDEELTDVKTAIQGKPDIKDSDATGVDLDITDPSGNVIVRLKNGHVQTKNFDSSHMTETLFDDAENTDLDMTDEEGHVLARFADGHFKTKNFNSKDVIALENVIFPEKGTSVTVSNVTDLLDEIENGTTEIIYLENGTYNLLNVEVNRKVQIIGKSRTRVLLVSDGTEDQEHDVTAKHGIRFNYGGALKNLTFSVNDVKYVMHQDEIYREYDLAIENCTFKRYDDSCGYYFFIGCGCLGKQNITVKNCSFVFDPNTNNRVSYGVYWHNWHLAKNALCAFMANLIIDSCDCVGCGIVIAQDLSDKTVNDFISVLNTYSTESTPVSSGANGTYISVTSENVPYNIVFIINCKIGNMRLQDRDQDEYDYLGAVVTNFVS